jgi:hypothetical protein
MKKTMVSRSALFLGTLLAVTVLAAIPGYGRSTTGMNSFHVVGSNPGNYGCLFENWGGVVNHCNQQVPLVFETVVDTAGWHGIDVVDKSGGPAFTCMAFSYSPDGQYYYAGTQATFNPETQETIHFSVFVGNGYSMSLSCTLPQYSGISSLNWNP